MPPRPCGPRRRRRWRARFRSREPLLGPRRGGRPARPSSGRASRWRRWSGQRARTWSSRGGAPRPPTRRPEPGLPAGRAEDRRPSSSSGRPSILRARWASLPAGTGSSGSRSTGTASSISPGWRTASRGVAARVLVSIQTANNETGVLQPVAEAAGSSMRRAGSSNRTRSRRPARCRWTRRARRRRPDSLGHKLGGPKGVGALVLASDRLEIADRLVRGGGQERGYRAGTENVAGDRRVRGGGRRPRGWPRRGGRPGCARCAQAEAALRRPFPDAVVFGAGAERLPNTLAFAVPGLKAETALIAFDLEGRRPLVGLGLLVGQGQALPCARGHGEWSPARRGRFAREFRVEFHRRGRLALRGTCETVVATLYKRRAGAAFERPRSRHDPSTRGP